MHPFFKNKYVRIVGFVLMALMLIFITLLFLLTSLNSARTGSGLYTGNYGEPTFKNSLSATDSAGSRMYQDEMADTSVYYPTTPTPQGYTSGLETHETTNYSVTGSTKAFDSVCATLEELKSDLGIHFKNLNTSLNNCSATFYVEEAKVAGVVSGLKQYQDLKLSRSTVSVTQHKKRIESQTAILEQQLVSTQKLLTEAEKDFADLTNFAKKSNDADAYAKAIKGKIDLIDTLTQRKIQFTSQLNNYYQQAADLNERLGVVEFSVNISRFDPIYPNENLRKWQNAWNELSDTFIETLIGLTAFFGVFLLWTARITVYLLVLLVIVRGLWKFVKLLWSK